MNKLLLTANLLCCLTGFNTAHAMSSCLDVSLDDANGPSLLRPTFTPQECDLVQSQLRTSGKFPNIFNRRANNLLLTALETPLCFVSNQNDQFNITSGIHAVLSSGKNSRKITINSSSIWTNQFQPNLPAFGLFGHDKQASVITQWIVVDNQTNKTIGKGYTADLLDTSLLDPSILSPEQLATLAVGSASELNVIIGGTDKLSGASGAIRVDSQLNTNGFPVITKISGKLCSAE
jgi:hypothetical protein